MALTDKLALCLLADLKDDLGITGSSDDARLERRILSASDMIVRYLNRPLRREVNRVEYVAGYGTPKLLLDLTPIESVASVEYDGDLIAPEAYSITPDKLFLFSETGWQWTALGLQTSARELAQVPGTERTDFKVTFTGGYYLPNDTAQTGTALPNAISEACLMLASTLHLARGRDGSVQGESVGGASVQMRVSYEGDGSANGMPATVVRMLSPFKRAV